MQTSRARASGQQAAAYDAEEEEEEEEEEDDDEDDTPVTQEELQELLSHLGASGDGALSSDAAQGMLARLSELTAMRERISELKAHQAEQAELLATRDELERRMQELEEANDAQSPSGSAGGPTSGPTQELTDADTAQANAAELTADLSDADVQRLLVERFEMDLTGENMDGAELRELLALLVHRDALQERLQEQAAMLQGLTEEAESLQAQQADGAHPAASAGGVGAAAPPPAPTTTLATTAAAGSEIATGQSGLQLPEGLDPAAAAQLQGYADRLSQLLALKHALEVQLADESGAPAPTHGAPDADSFLQQFLESTGDGSSAGQGATPALMNAPPQAPVEGGVNEDEPMTDEEAQELLAMQDELLSMQRQRNEMMSRLAELRAARDGLAGQLAEAQEMRATQPLDFGAGVPPRYTSSAVSAGSAPAPAGGIGAATGDDSDAYTDDFEEGEGGPTEQAPLPSDGDDEGDGDETGDMLSQLGEMNSRLDGLLQLVQAAKGGAEGQGAPPSEDAMRALMEAVGPLLGAAGSMDALMDAEEGGSGSSTLAANLTKAMFGDLPMGEAISRELQASAAQQQQQGNPAGAGFVSPPRPRTSRKVSNPSPDVFTDYVTPTGDVPAGFAPSNQRNNPSGRAQRPKSAKFGRRSAQGASTGSGTVTPPVGVMDIHDSDSEQGTTVLTLDSRMRQQQSPAAAAAAARDAAFAARHSASAADATAAQLGSARAAHAAQVAASNAAAAAADAGEDDDAASVASADTAALIAAYMRAFAHQLGALPKSVLRNKSLGDALQQATSSVVQNAVQRSRPGTRRVRASRDSAPPQQGGTPDEGGFVSDETPFGHTPTFGAAAAPKEALPPTHTGTRRGAAAATAGAGRKAAVSKKAHRPKSSHGGGSSGTAQRRRVSAAAKMHRAQQERSGSMDASDDARQHVGGVRRTRPLFPRRMARTRKGEGDSLNTSLASADGASGPHPRKRRATSGVGASKSGVKRRGVGSSSASPEAALGGEPKGGPGGSSSGYGSSSAMSSSAGGDSADEAPPRQEYDVSFDADGPFSPGAGWESRNVTENNDSLQVTVSASGADGWEAQDHGAAVGRALQKVQGVKQTLSGMRQRSPIKGSTQPHAFDATAPAPSAAAAATLPRFSASLSGEFPSEEQSPVISRGHSIEHSQYDFEVTEDAIRDDPSVQAQEAEHAAAAAAAGLGHRLRQRAGTEEESMDTPLHSDEESEDSEAAHPATRAVDSYDDDLDWLAAPSGPAGHVKDGSGPFGSAGAALLNQQRSRDEQITYVRNAPRRERNGRGGLPLPVLASRTGGIALPLPPSSNAGQQMAQIVPPPAAPPRRSSLDHGSYRPRGTSSGAASDSSSNIWQEAAAAAATAARYGLDDSQDGGYSSRERDSQSLFRLGQLRSNHDAQSRAAGTQGGWGGGGGHALPPPLPPAAQEDTGSWSWDGPGGDSPWGDDSTWDGPAPATLPGQRRWKPPSPRAEGGDAGSISAWHGGSDGADDALSGSSSHGAGLAAAGQRQHSPVSAVEAALLHSAWLRGGLPQQRDFSQDLASGASDASSSSEHSSSCSDGGSSAEGGSHGDVEGGWYEVDSSAQGDSSQWDSDHDQSVASLGSSFAAQHSSVQVPPSLRAEPATAAWAVGVDAEEALPLSGSSRASLGSTPEHATSAHRVDKIAVDVDTPSARQVQAAAAARRGGAAPLVGAFVSPTSVRSQTQEVSDYGTAALASPQHSIDFALSPDGEEGAVPVWCKGGGVDHEGGGSGARASAAALESDRELATNAALRADALQQVLFGRLAHSRRDKSSFSVQSVGSTASREQGPDAGPDDPTQDELRSTLQLLTLMRQDSDSAEQYIRSPEFGRSRAGSLVPAEAQQAAVEGFAPTADEHGDDALLPGADGGVGQYQRFRMVRSAQPGSGVEGRPLFELQQEQAEKNKQHTKENTQAVDSAPQSDGGAAPLLPTVEATHLTDRGLKVPVSALQAAAAGGGNVDQVAHLNRALLSNAAALLGSSSGQGAESNPAWQMLMRNQAADSSSDSDSG